MAITGNDRACVIVKLTTAWNALRNSLSLVEDINWT